MLVLREESVSGSWMGREVYFCVEGGNSKGIFAAFLFLFSILFARRSRDLGRREMNYEMSEELPEEPPWKMRNLKFPKHKEISNTGLRSIRRSHTTRRPPSMHIPTLRIRVRPGNIPADLTDDMVEHGAGGCGTVYTIMETIT